MEMWRLLAHSHWMTLELFGRELRLCSRCTGYVLGFAAMTAVGSFRILSLFGSIPVTYHFLFCLFLLTPMIVDWVTQSWGRRESNNRLRLLTGFLVGLGVALFSAVDAPRDLKILFYFYTGAGILAGGIIGKRSRATVPKCCIE